jgi:hypothetical protein
MIIIGVKKEKARRRIEQKKNSIYFVFCYHHSVKSEYNVQAKTSAHGNSFYLDIVLNIMRTNKKSIIRRLIFGIISIIIIYSFYYHSITKSGTMFVPLVRIRSNQNSSFKKISIAYYTTSYRVRIDSHTNIFNPNLKQICDIIDPEEYPYADSVIVILVDFVNFLNLANEKNLYRKKYQSQLWLLHAEESPRNSYRTVRVKNITELDDWFNLTATLKPESDVHIQYKVGFLMKLISNEIVYFDRDIVLNPK